MFYADRTIETLHNDNEWIEINYGFGFNAKETVSRVRDDRNTIEDPCRLAKNGQKSRVNSETTNDLEPGITRVAGPRGQTSSRALTARAR
ncbi:hypothetical protein EVAR_51401_1 [Eumeta japonica]|uniref:Uncharacterized protein n=1 Tax=Eumeta variegata TaxID=151549 RepID=A0A4C1ZSN0_EUMVA|nr:hypothetical protein EVAR_51401_1 [Eumeta japonica]